MSSKVKPYDIHVPLTPQTKQNNFFKSGKNLIKQLRFLIVLQSLLGINRLYLFKSTVSTRLCYLYSSVLFATTMAFLIVPDNSDKSYRSFKESTSVEYLILIFVSAFTYRETLENFFKDLSVFDDMLNISEISAAATLKSKRPVLWMASSLFYCISEGVLFHVLFDFPFNLATMLFYMATLAHDSEQVIFVTLIKTIMIRVKVLRSHIIKSYNTDKYEDTKDDLDDIKGLITNAQLDTTAMHRAYELLHNCADQLNAAMSFPMIVMLFTSGLSTTMMLKRFVQMTQETNDEGTSSTFNAMLVYTLVRCIKYTILVIIPCYYASVTSRIVVKIRTVLHNAVNTFKVDKIERRKLKAFFYLAQDNDFSYALWGVIRLSMSLPLSYASLCTTYLVIVIQFSKFID